jgi:predicted neuraminidase
MLSDKRMVLGLYSDVYMTSLACFTEDGGATWEFGEPMADYGLIQPALVQRKDGTLVAYGRDKGPAKKIRVAESKNGGQTWAKFYDLPVDNPDSSVSVVALKNGHWVLICNDLPGDDGRHGRSRLVALLSDDEGSTWKWRRVIEDSTNPPDFHPHAAYPSVIQGTDGLIHVVYTYTPGDEAIKHVAFNEAWLQEAGQ